MNEHERITTLVTAGSITEDEAEILLAALAESHENYKNHESYESRESEEDRLAPSIIPAQYDGIVPPTPPAQPISPTPPASPTLPTSLTPASLSDEVLQNEIEMLETLRVLTEKSDGLLEEKDAHTEIMQQLETKRVALKDEVEALYAKMVEASEEESGEIQADLTKCEEKLAETQAQQADKKAIIQQLEGQIQDVEQEIDDTKQVLHALRDEANLPEMESFTTPDGYQVYMHRTGGKHQTKEEAAAARARLVDNVTAVHLAQEAIAARVDAKQMAKQAKVEAKEARKAAREAQREVQREVQCEVQHEARQKVKEAARQSKRKAKGSTTDTQSFEKKIENAVEGFVSKQGFEAKIENAVEGFVSKLIRGFGGEHSYVPTEDDAVPANWLKLTGSCGDLTVRCNPNIDVPRVEGNAVLTQLESGGYLIKTPSGSGSGWLKNLHKIASDIVIEVPNHLSLEMNMAAGDADISGVEALAGRFVGGDFDAKQVTALDLLITAGDISVSALLSEGNHKLAVIAGDVTLDFVQGSAVVLEAKGTSADMTVNSVTKQEESSLNFRKKFSCTLGEASDTPAYLDFNFTAGDITISDNISAEEVKE